MAAKTKTAPAPKNLGELAEAVAKLPQNQAYSSAAVLFRAAHPEVPKTLGTQGRGVFRALNQGVGRGKRYGITPGDFAKAYKTVLAQREQAKATAKAAKADAKKKETAKA